MELLTGETSPQVMASLGAKFCLIGHSERRGLFQETDSQVLEKVKAAQEFNLTPLICIGESLKERQAGATLKRLETQLSLGLQGVQISQNKNLYIAYEPLWAIGTGEVASPPSSGGSPWLCEKLSPESIPPSSQKNSHSLWRFCET